MSVQLLTYVYFILIEINVFPLQTKSFTFSAASVQSEDDSKHNVARRFSCGKTHLLNAVEKEYQNKYPTRAIIATTFEDLISQYLKTIDKKRTLEFRRYICSYDLLIIDNMQFAIGKSATQEEFSYWFSAMLDACKSVIIAWDSSERCLDVLLTRMSDRYLDRCHILKMNEPDVMLRKEYLQRLIGSVQISIPSEVCKCVINSEMVPLCAFNGYLMRLKAFQEQKGRQLTKREMLECVNEYIANEQEYGG